MALPTKHTMLNQSADFDTFRNGGKGSGNFGHSGRPGKIGGSGNGQGKTVAEKEEDKAGGFKLDEENSRLFEQNADKYRKLAKKNIMDAKAIDPEFARTQISLLKKSLKKQGIKQEEVLAIRNQIVEDARKKLGDTWDSSNPNYHKSVQVPKEKIGGFLAGEALWNYTHTGTSSDYTPGVGWHRVKEYGDTVYSLLDVSDYNNGKVNSVEVAPYNYFGRKMASVKTKQK